MSSPPVVRFYNKRRTAERRIEKGKHTPGLKCCDEADPREQRSISGGSGSSQPSARWTLLDFSLAATTVALAIEQQRRTIADQLEVSISGALLRPLLDRHLNSVGQHY